MGWAGYTAVIPTNVYSLTAHSQRNVNAIVDQKWDVVSLCDCVKFSSQVDECARAEGLFAQLDYGNSTDESLFDLPGQSASRRDESGVGDEVKRKIEGWFWHCEQLDMISIDGSCAWIDGGVGGFN